MIALYDFVPKYCPNCGEPVVLRRGLELSDYYAKCSFSCDCGVGMQKANADELRKAAQNSGGDLADYH